MMHESMVTGVSNWQNGASHIRFDPKVLQMGPMRAKMYWNLIWKVPYLFRLGQNCPTFSQNLKDTPGRYIYCQRRTHWGPHWQRCATCLTVDRPAHDKVDRFIANQEASSIRQKSTIDASWVANSIVMEAYLLSIGFSLVRFNGTLKTRRSFWCQGCVNSIRESQD